MTDSLRILMTSIIDYAGLFPPAKLDLPTTLTNWRRYAAGEHAWMLSRLIIPATRLEEFGALLEREGCVPEPGQETWRISSIVADAPDADIDRVFAFNQRYAGAGASPDLAPGDPREPDPMSDVPDVLQTGGVVVDAIELRALSPGQVDRAMKVIPEQLEPFFEVSVIGGTEVRGMITAMAGTGACAKIRTGGVTPEAFPLSREVARFIAACSAADVPFKATAGLHHPLRGRFPLTYEPGCPSGVMFGFLNVFLAAALVRQSRLPESEAVALLEEENPRTIVFGADGVTWRDQRIDNARLARVRESFAVSFGSCSFEEPIADLKSLGLLA